MVKKYIVDLLAGEKMSKVIVTEKIIFQYVSEWDTTNFTPTKVEVITDG